MTLSADGSERLKVAIAQREKATSRREPDGWPLDLEGNSDMYKTLLAALTATALSAGAAAAAPAVSQEPLDVATLNTITSQFGRLMELANKHDFKALHGMFWQSRSTLLVAKSAIPSEGNWAGFWGNDAVDQKLHDIGNSGPVVLEPDY